MRFGEPSCVGCVLHLVSFSLAETQLVGAQISCLKTLDMSEGRDSGLCASR